MATNIWVNIGSDNDLLPGGTNPLPESMLTYHQRGLHILTWKKTHEISQPPIAKMNLKAN